MESSGKRQGTEVEEAGLKTSGVTPHVSEGVCLNHCETTSGSHAVVCKWEEKILALERPGNRGLNLQEIATCPNLKQEVQRVLDLQLGLEWKLEREREKCFLIRLNGESEPED
jgi:hypothetical protein